MYDDFDSDGQEACDALRKMAGSTTKEVLIDDLVQELRNWLRGTVGEEYVGHISCALVNRAANVIEQQAKTIAELEKELGNGASSEPVVICEFCGGNKLPYEGCGWCE